MEKRYLSKQHEELIHGNKTNKLKISTLYNQSIASNTQFNIASN